MKSILLKNFRSSFANLRTNGGAIEIIGDVSVHAEPVEAFLGLFSRIKVGGGATIWDFVRRSLILAVVLTFGTFVGCAGPMSQPVQQPFSPAKHRAIRLQICAGQSADRGNWNLAEEASRALTEKVAATRHFEISSEPGLVFSCNVEGVVDRNSFQRGPALFGNLSEVRVTVILWESPGDGIIATFRGFAALPPGSMGTIDDPRRLVAAAMNDVANQLEAWVKASGDKK